MDKGKMDQDTSTYKITISSLDFAPSQWQNESSQQWRILLKFPVSAHSLFNFINSASKLLSRCHTTGGGGAGAVFRIEDIFLLNHFLKVHSHHFSQIKSPKEVTKHWESRFFLLFSLEDRRIRIWIHTSD
jgi:hypothetical protein